MIKAFISQTLNLKREAESLMLFFFCFGKMEYQKKKIFFFSHLIFTEYGFVCLLFIFSLFYLRMYLYGKFLSFFFFIYLILPKKIDLNWATNNKIRNLNSVFFSLVGGVFLFIIKKQFSPYDHE